MKMTGLWLITVTMAFCLIAGSLAEIDKAKLAGLIQTIKTDIKQKYNINSMYAVALSIPKDSNQVSYDLTKVTGPLEDQNKWNTEHDKFTSQRLVVAMKKDIENNPGIKFYTEHAEWRVLQNLNLQNQKGDLLVFFSHASPCAEKCANPKGNYRITDGLHGVFNKEWGDKAFVFEMLFKPRGQEIDKDTIKQSLKHIGNSIGLKNVFRCYKPKNAPFQCISCANGDQVNQRCYDEHETVPGNQQNTAVIFKTFKKQKHPKTMGQSF